MILAALLMVAAAGPLDEAEAALAAGRLVQTRTMIATMHGQGVRGARFDRLRAGHALAGGDPLEALRLYGALAWRDRTSAADREGAAIAAYRLGRRAEARAWTSGAIALDGAGWRAFNLCGVLADEDGDFAAAEQCYDEAEARAPGRGEIANNRAFSLLLQGRWQAAAAGFEAALARDPADRIARSNLDLARAALSADLPARDAGEDAADYARRLNDSGVMAAAAGDRQRALAAFARAIDIAPRWSPVMGRNLDDASRR